MLARLDQALCVVALVAGAPAYAAEVGDELWDCTLMTRDGLSAGMAKYEISGNKLVDLTPPLAIHPLNETPIQGLFWYQILENNDAGIVAGSPRSIIGHSPKDGSPVTVMIGAAIIVINKSNGKLQIGSVMQDGAHQIQDGYCKLDSTIP